MHYSSVMLALLGWLLPLSSPPATGPDKPRPAKHGAVAHPQPTSIRPPLYLSRPRLVVERLNSRMARLRWNAVPETTSQGYRVERSSDGDHWTYHDYVRVNATHRYHYEDTCRSAFYYRVVRLDFSRRLTPSLRVPSPYARPTGPLLAQPNPARGPVRLLGHDPLLSLDVLDGRGVLVRQIHTATFNTGSLRPGVYALRQGHRITRFAVR